MGGTIIKQDLAILLTSNVSTYEYSGFGRQRKRDFGIVAPSVQYWLNNKFWVLGGVGLGIDAPVFWDIKNPETNNEEVKYHTGLGLVTALGYEFYKKKNFTMDLKTRISYRSVAFPEGRISGFSPAILLGFNFY